ncbi:MAG TPA: tail fiber domain-containing protein, partial [Chitinophagaceae bacterium]|nr:tail fiber domain-containing protein [Chitinophagaceae bacterium]
LTDNVFLGGRFFLHNKGIDNTFLGDSAGVRTTTGERNTGLGEQALRYLTRGRENTAIGYTALFNDSVGNYNSALGSGALYRNASGSYNLSAGRNSLYNNTIGSQNVALGSDALFNNHTAWYNVAVGRAALFNNTTNNDNTAIGDAAGYYYALQSTFVGSLAYGPTNYAVINSTAIGYQSRVTSDNQVRLGNSSVTSIGGYAGWTTLPSDGRFKKNVKENVPGLSFITALRPVTYTLDVEALENLTGVSGPLPGGRTKETSPETVAARQAKAKIVHTGFVAQEVEEAARKLEYDFSGIDVPKSGQDLYGIRYAEFVVPLVKAVQELNEENKKLKEENSGIRQELEEIRKLIAELKNDPVPGRTGSGGGYLQGASPNPSSGVTTIRYHLAEGTGTATLTVTNMKGQVLKSVRLNNRGNGQATLQTAGIPSGTYNYTLWIGGKKADSQQLIITR